MDDRKSLFLRARDGVRRILVDNLHVRREPDEIDVEAPLFGTGLGLDSVDAIELVVAVEAAFGISMPDSADSRSHLRSVGTLVDLVMDRVAKPTNLAKVEPLPAKDAPPDHEALLSAMTALRTATTITVTERIVVARISGEHAFEAVDAVSSAPLRLREAEMRPSLLLREDGTIFADVYVCRDDDAFLLVSEGPSPSELVAYLEQHARAAVPMDASSLVIETLDRSHTVLSVNGPWAWELLGDVLGPDLIGIPYLSMMRVDGVLCLRAGKTGEYGYDLLVPNDAVAAVRARLEKGGEAFGLIEVSADLLDVAALENGFFCIRHGKGTPLDDARPIERQLQWRVSYSKKHVGSDATVASRTAGPRSVSALALSSHRVEVGVEVASGGAAVGKVAVCEWSPLRHGFATLVWVSPDIAARGGSVVLDVVGRPECKLVTMRAPLIDNRSLYVSPQRHAYSTRETARFPKLVP